MIYENKGTLLGQRSFSKSPNVETDVEYSMLDFFMFLLFLHYLFQYHLQSGDEGDIQNLISL
jgi:hypothetical protein